MTDKTSDGPQEALYGPESAQEVSGGELAGRDRDRGAEAGSGDSGALDVQGRCPACGGDSLMLADGGYITCRRLDCPRPDLVNELIGEIGDARNHAGYTFCSQSVGHVTMTEFAKKITEKVTAVAHRKEAVDYANKQKRRAERAEAALARVRDLCSPEQNADALGHLRRSQDVLAALDEPAPAATEATEPQEQP